MYTKEEDKVFQEIVCNLAIAAENTASKYTRSPVHLMLITYACCVIVTSQNTASEAPIELKFLAYDFMRQLHKMRDISPPPVWSDSLFAKLGQEVSSLTQAMAGGVGVPN